ncbi:hypothetical protein ACKGJO_11500 [Gracilimonas sp. Q87]|uniref:hypothetical protein n=1 Tax=Gracilimonas sp. Q87 TaxID=3384766 RepID=UPI003984609F
MAVSGSYINFLGETSICFTRLKIGEKDCGSISFGVGINIGDLSFDISRNSYSDLGGLTRLSLKTKLR